MKRLTKKDKMIQLYKETYKNENLKVKTFENSKACVMIFKAKNCYAVAIWYHNSTDIKPFVTGYNTKEQAQEAFKTAVNSIERAIRKHQDDLVKYAKEAEKIQKGSIMVCSWGYEQTNIDFYEVIERKGKTITLEEIGKKISFI